MSDEHLVDTKFGLLECRSVRRKPLGELWSRRETGEARGTKWNFDVERDVGVPALLELPCDSAFTSATTRQLGIQATWTRSSRESTQDQNILVRSRQNSWVPSMRDSWTWEISYSRMQNCTRCMGGELTDCNSEEVKRGEEVDQDTRPLLNSCATRRPVGAVKSLSHPWVGNWPIHVSEKIA